MLTLLIDWKIIEKFNLHRNTCDDIGSKGFERRTQDDYERKIAFNYKEVASKGPLFNLNNAGEAVQAYKTSEFEINFLATKITQKTLLNPRKFPQNTYQIHFDLEINFPTSANARKFSFTLTEKLKKKLKTRISLGLKRQFRTQYKSQLFSLEFAYWLSGSNMK